MPQLMIDTSTESADALLRTSIYLRDIARMKDADVEILAAKSAEVERSASEPVQVTPPAAETVQRDPAVLFGSNRVPAGTPIPPPPPAANPSTPTVAASATAPAVNSVNTTTPAFPDVDVTGAAHDPALHSTPPKRNADGKWRARRGLDKVNPTSAATAGVPASQTTSAAAATAGGPTTTNPTTTISPSEIPPPPGTPPVSLHVPPAPAAGGPAAILPGAPSEPVIDFRTLMKAISPLIAEKRLTSEMLETICLAYGVNGVGQLAPQPMLIPKVWESIRATCGIA